MAFETMVDLLKDQEMDRLIEPCRRLWAFRQKKNELSRNYKIMKNQRQLMEKQIQIQNSVLNNLNETIKRTDSGYTGNNLRMLSFKMVENKSILHCMYT